MDKEKEDFDNQVFEKPVDHDERKGRSSFFVGRRMSRFTKAEKSATVAHPLDALDHAEIIQTVQSLQKQLKHLETENSVFLHFLQEQDPTALEDLEDISADKSFHSRRSVSFRLAKTPEDSKQSKDIHSSLTSGVSQVSESHLKVNLTQKTDLVLREMDKVQMQLDESQKKWSKVKLIMLSKLEELDCQKVELVEALDSFEKFKQSQEPITFQRFARFMDEMSKKFHLMVDKLRLRHSSLKVQYHKICATLANKKLIGENLQEIDFEQLRIENIHLNENIEKKSLLLIELKKMTGAGNLRLSQQKRILLTKMETKEKLNKEIDDIDNEITKSDNQIIKLNKELEEVKKEYKEIKYKVEHYSAPDILDYIKKKVELKNLNRDLKMWARKVHVKNLAVNVASTQLKKMLGGHPINPIWLE